MRITIHIDMSGFSFDFTRGWGIPSVRQDRRLCAGPLSYENVLAQLKDFMKERHEAECSSALVYVSTPHYCLVPSALFNESDAERLLSDSCKWNQECETARFVAIPDYDAFLIYSYPKMVEDELSDYPGEIVFLPESYFLIETLKRNQEFSKFSVMFSNGMIHIAAAEGNKLLMANSYPVYDFVTAEYYALSVSREIMFNPEQTVLHIYGLELPEQNNLDALDRYFAGYKTHKL